MLRYSLDPARLTLSHFLELTSKKKSLTGHGLLQENREEQLALLRKSGIANLADLLAALASRVKLEAFAKESGLDATYLEALAREAGSCLIQARPLSDFPGVPFEYTELLKSLGIGDTRRFFELAQTETQREKLSLKTGIPQARLKELFVLCDLSRIQGLNGNMARRIYEAGIRSTADLADSEEGTADRFSDEEFPYFFHYASVIRFLDAPAKQGLQFDQA